MGYSEQNLKKCSHPQEERPGRRLFFQPHARREMVRLRDTNPNEECPVTVYFSTTDDLSTVSYQAEIVEWRNKQNLAETECPSIDREIEEVGFNPEGLFGIEEGMVNLVRIRYLIKLVPSFHVAELIKTSDGKPLSGNQISSGPSYVYDRAEYPQMIINLIELVGG